MREFYFSLVLICFIMIEGCKPKREQQKLDIPIEEINLSDLTVDSTSTPDAVFKKTHYILLSTSSDDGVLGRIDKVLINESKIYVLDERLKNLAVFNTDGNFITKIGKIGKGEKEYRQITDFDIKEDGSVLILDAFLDNDRLLTYGKDFNYISTKKLPFDADVIKTLPDGSVLLGLSSWNKGEFAGDKVIMLDQAGKIKASPLKYDEFVDDSFWISPYHFVKRANHILYNKPIDNTVYEFSDNGELVKGFNFDFGGMNVPNEDKIDVESKKDKYNKYRLLKDFTIISDHIIFGALLDRNKSRLFAIERDAQKLYLGKPVNVLAATGDLIGFDGQSIISYLFPGKLDDSLSKALPKEVVTHLKKDRYVLCFHEII